jgi:rRNA maturation protein Nop10
MDNNEKQPARPIDLFNPSIGRVTKQVAYDRYDICKECDKLNTLTKTCSECGCFMRSKVTLPNAFCPLGKWGTKQKANKEN